MGRKVTDLVVVLRYLGGDVRQAAELPPEDHGQRHRRDARRGARGHRHRVEPRLCAVARPEHKGKVERAIRYLRDRFLAGRTITGVADGNRALARFIADIGHARPHPRLAPRTVADVFADEHARLLSLPDPLPCTDRIEPTPIDSQAFVRFDTNR